MVEIFPEGLLDGRKVFTKLEKTKLEVDEVLVTGLCPIFTDNGVIDWQQRRFYLEWMSCIRVYQEIRYADMLDSKTWNRL